MPNEVALNINLKDSSDNAPETGGVSADNPLDELESLPGIGGAMGQFSGLSGGANMASLAGSAGIVGAIVAGVSAVSQELSEKLRNSLETFAGAFSPETDAFGSVASSLKSASSGLDPIQDKFGINIGFLDDAFASLADTVTSVTSSLSSLSETAAQFNGELAMTQGQNEIREINTQIDRARRVGPDLARFSSAQSRADAALEEIKTILMENFLPSIASLAEFAAEILQIISAIWKAADSVGLKVNPIEYIRHIWKGLRDEFGFKDSDLEMFRETILFFLGPFAGVVREHIRNKDDETDEFVKQLEKFFDEGDFLAHVGDFDGPLPGGT